MHNNQEFVVENKNVVLAFSFKDCVSEGGLRRELVSKEAVENFLGIINLEGDNDFVGLLRSARTL